MSEKLIPEVLWAQRSSESAPEKNFVYLTISVPDVSKEDLKLDLKPTGLTFSGASGTLKRSYHVELEFFGEIDPAASAIQHTAKNIEMRLQKKELKLEYWPRLLKEKNRYHFLKTDFDKWVDEDEQNEAGEEDLSQFGGMGGMPGGMPGMEGMEGMGGDFGGLDFSKLGGAMGGMGGGMPDFANLAGAAGAGAGAGADDDDDDDDDDEGLPELEEVTDEAKA